MSPASEERSRLFGATRCLTTVPAATADEDDAPELRQSGCATCLRSLPERIGERVGDLRFCDEVCVGRWRP